MNNPSGMFVGSKLGNLLLKVTIVATAVVGGAGIVSSNVFASFTATASNTSGGSITSGTLKLVLAPSTVPGITNGFTGAIANMGSGDVVNRFIDLTNSGTLDGSSPTLQIAVSESNTLTANPTKGLQIAISSCSIAWTALGACNETTTVVMTSRPLSTVVTSAQSLTLASNLAGSVNRLKVSTIFPNSTENVVNGALPVNTVQGLSASLTWSFVILERAATTTNS
jgi:hypothetical protein